MVQGVSVREMIESDIPYILDYWYQPDKAFLEGMGVDLAKLPKPEDFRKMLLQQIALPDHEKASFAMILEKDGTPLGHCNVNNITFGKEASMHLHLWQGNSRQKGLGTFMVRQSLPVFFRRLDLQTIWSEPYANNPAPNRTLTNIGFEFVKRYVTTPGSITFEQEVNRYKLSRERFEAMG